MIRTDTEKDPRLLPFGPNNFGTPLELLEGLIVPVRLFYVRANGPMTVEIPADEWRLTVTGLVQRTRVIGLADLQTMPRRTITAFLECAGNSRNRFEPPAEGTPWGEQAVGNAEWTGVPLIEVLERAGVQDGVVEVVSQGADFPEMQRGLPLAVARDPDTMLVWQMNGEDLPAIHGGPVRLFVPRWAGVASTKWIIGLHAIDHPFEGHYNTERYVFVTADGAYTGPVQLMPVKSVISTPAAGRTLAPGRQTIAGYAWSGHGSIDRVEISVDGGASWAGAEITDAAGPLSWVRFAFAWDAMPGRARLRSRATDECGNIQPDAVPWNVHGYQMNAVFELPITVV